VRQAEKVQRIHAVLEERIPEVPIPLLHVDPFTLLVAVLLSAQTTDKKVNEVTPELFRRAGTPAQMAAMNVDEVRELIAVIGLAPTKARNLVRLSQILLDEHDGRVPESFDHLEALPGVGHKTASVVMSQAFGHPAFPVDTHIHRLAWRWGLSDGMSVERTEGDLKRLFPQSSWNRLHLQIIYFGRQFCPARSHDPVGCPICSWAGIKSRLKQEAAGGPRKTPRRTRKGA
jgi:endonuclease-3